MIQLIGLRGPFRSVIEIGNGIFGKLCIFTLWVFGPETPKNDFSGAMSEVLSETADRLLCVQFSIVANHDSIEAAYSRYEFAWFFLHPANLPASFS